MYQDQLFTMNPFVLLSIINMKLRDEFSSLDALCEDFGVDCNDILNRLKSIGYIYYENTNQFISEEALK